MRKIFGLALLGATLAVLPVAAQDHDTVRAAQQALKDKGFDPGPIDGVKGPQTRAALKKYQHQQNLNADGRFGAKTLDSLGVQQSNPKTNFKASGENVKNSYTSGGKTIGNGSKEMADQVKDGHVGSGAADFGKGVGKGVAKMGVGTGHAAKNVGKGIKNAVTGDSKKTEQ